MTDASQSDDAASDAAAKAASAAPLSLTGMLDVIRANAEDDGVLTVGELLEAFGPRAHGPLLFAPALIAVAPVVGGLPGISLTMGALMLLFAAQLALGLPRPWAPKALQDVKMPGSAVTKALDLLAPVTRAADRVFKPRFQMFARPPWLRLTGAIAVFAALLACIGALVPGLIVPPALVIIVLAVGLTTEDGLVLLVAYALTAATAWAGWWLAMRLGVV